MPARCTASAACVALLAAVVGLTACSGGGKDATTSESVFDVRSGECFVPPAAVKAELSDLTRVACEKPHSQESYAIVAYRDVAAGASPGASAFPGSDVLGTFAQGVCAQRFTGYVGVDYRDSSLFFTYLLPSARSWEQNDDRNVLCFVTTTGGSLTSSVKGSKQ